MRFFDEILRRGITNATPALKWMGATMSGATVVAVDNVTEYYYALSDQEDWIFPRDFPNVAPPFTNFFIESTRPTKMVSTLYGTTAYDGADRWGFWVKAVDMRVGDSSALRAKIAALHPHLNDAQQTLVDETRWVLEIISFFCFPADSLLAVENRAADVHIGTAGKCFLFVRDDGSAIQFTENYPGEAWLWHGLPPHTDKLNDALQQVAQVTGYGVTGDGDRHLEGGHCREFFRILLQPCLLALSFMHCKNTALVDERPPRQQRRAAERAGKPLTVFKTIYIQPIEQVLRRRSVGPRGSSGIKMRLHIRRGRFRDYRQGNGLFGKYHGLFWWEDRLVGTPDVGVVEKDYRVSP